MVPCGLPATVTSILTIVARSLANKSVYLKRLDVVQALGAVTIIASDKTGTLTKNIMTVTDLWYYNKKINGYVEEKSSSSADNKVYSAPVEKLLKIMSVCNMAPIQENNKEQITLEMESNDAEFRKPAIGSASEIAMLKYAEMHVDVRKLRKAHNLVFDKPFNSTRKYHLQIYKILPVGNGYYEYQVAIKGAPEVIMGLCSTIITEEGSAIMTDEKMTAYDKACKSFGEQGKRVIGFAETTFVAPSHTVFSANILNYPMEKMTFCGIVALMDPPRQETPDAIFACQQAGIRVFMVTGDHPVTAEAIAIQIGLITKEDRNSCVIHGNRISKMTEKEWDRVLSHRNLVFARTTPEQKMKIVTECQKRGELIAMTGDGVNDSPALKKANVGVAMGSGSEVAKQAADIILMNDNFSSLISAIEQGRLMYENVKKVLAYTMPHSFPEIFPVCLTFLFGLPMGITSLQIITIDLGTELGPGVAMSQEPIENSVMNRPPRRQEKLVSNGLLIYGYVYAGLLHSSACMVVYFYTYWKNGINISDLFFTAHTSWQEGGANFTSNGKVYDWPAQQLMMAEACSAWHIGIVFIQWWHVWAARTRRESIFTQGLFTNFYSLAGLCFELCLLCICIYCPGFNTIIGGAPPPVEVWGIIACFGIFIVFYNEIRKYYLREYPDNTIVKLFSW